MQHANVDYNKTMCTTKPIILIFVVYYEEISNHFKIAGWECQLPFLTSSIQITPRLWVWWSLSQCKRSLMAFPIIIVVSPRLYTNHVTKEDGKL